MVYNDEVLVCNDNVKEFVYNVIVLVYNYKVLLNNERSIIIIWWWCLKYFRNKWSYDICSIIYEDILVRLLIIIYF